jgi:hypothetical protein
MCQDLPPLPASELKVVAILTTRADNRLALCHACLNWWLDAADDDPEVEPIELELLR